MTKSFEVSIAVMFLFLFVFFVFDIQNNKYEPTEVPEEIKSLILIKAKDSEFRNLIENENSENIYELLYNDINQKFGIEVCGESCVYAGYEMDGKSKKIEYYFAELDKRFFIYLLN